MIRSNIRESLNENEHFMHMRMLVKVLEYWQHTFYSINNHS